MSDLQTEYYVLDKPDQDGLPELSPDEDTSQVLLKTILPILGKPLKFTNKWRDKYNQRGIKEVIDKILFYASDVLIEDEIYQTLKAHNILDVSYYPAEYVDDSGNLHENFWFMKVLKTRDCWCRKQSDYMDSSPSSTGKYYIEKIVLDENVLNQVPVEQRLIFKLGGSMIAYTLIHKSLVDVFLNAGVNPESFIPIKDYWG